MRTSLTVTDVCAGLLLGLVAYLWINPQDFGIWKARVEYGFLLEADRMGMWGE